MGYTLAGDSAFLDFPMNELNIPDLEPLTQFEMAKGHPTRSDAPSLCDFRFCYAAESSNKGGILGIMKLY